MPSLETIRQLTIQARTDGFEQAQARLDSTSRSIGTMEGAVTRAERAFSPLYSATEKLTALSRTLALAVASGTRTQEQANAIYDAAVNKLTGYGRELDRVTKIEIQARAAREASAQALARANQQELNARLGVGRGSDRDAAADFQAAADAADRMRAKYDPLFAAAQRYSAARSEITSLEKAGVLAHDVATEALRRQTSAYNDVAQTMERAGAVQKASAQRQVNSQLIIPNRAADVAAYGDELDNLRARFNPLFAAERQHLDLLEQISRAARVGAISEAERAEAVQRAQRAYAQQVEGIKSQSQQAGRLSGYQAQNLLYQGTDIIASAASGMSPMTILLQQGGQIAPVFAGPGSASVKGALTQAGEAVTGFLGRIGLVGGAIGGAATGDIAGTAALLS